MKKTKTIDTYYCDYCGKECEHTPEYVLPEYKFIDETKSLKTIPVQKDICENCKHGIIKFSKMLDTRRFPVVW